MLLSLKTYYEDPPGGDPPTNEPPTPKTFTQAEVNKMLAEHKRGLQSQLQDALTRLEDIQQDGMTAEGKEALQNQIEDLKKQVMTKEQLAARERERLVKEAKDENAKLQKERDRWQQRYTQETIQREITDAAVVNEAVNPGHLVALLQGNTTLVEESDNGVPTGKLKATVAFEDTDKDGNPMTLQLSPREAVKRMKEMTEHQVLFKSGAVGGTGMSGSKGAKKGVPNLSDPATYAKWRKENPGVTPDAASFQ